MTAETFESLVGGLTQRAPFHSFTVELVGGHRYEIDHPRALVVRDGVAVFLKPSGTSLWFNRQSVTQFVGGSADASA